MYYCRFGLNWRGKEDAEHAWDTWRTPEGPKGHFWLREDLPKHVPGCRVLLYEYNSTLLFGKDRDGWVNKAGELLEAIRMERVEVDDPQRPIIFLGHSMGGLLIKQALVNACIDPFYRSIRDTTTGIAFFATPHQGARKILADLGSVASKLAVRLGFQKGKGDIIKALRGKGVFDDTLQEQWRPHLLRYNIVSFWGSRDAYVPEVSARFYLPRDLEAVVKLDADHRGVCKVGPRDRESQDNLKIVLFHIKELYRKALARGKKYCSSHPVSVKGKASTTSSSSQTESTSTSSNERKTDQPVEKDNKGTIDVSEATLAQLPSTIARGASESEVWDRISAILIPSEDKVLDDLLSMVVKGGVQTNATPEIITLWAKSCVSARAWNDLVQKFEPFVKRLSSHNQSPSQLELEDLLHHATVMKQLQHFSSAQVTALEEAARYHYSKDRKSARHKVMLGAGLFVGSAIMTTIVCSTDEEWSVGPGLDLSFNVSGSLLIASLGFTGYSVQTARKMEAKEQTASELSTRVISVERSLRKAEETLAAILIQTQGAGQMLMREHKEIRDKTGFDVRYFKDQEFMEVLLLDRIQNLIDRRKRFDTQAALVGADFGLCGMNSGLVESFFPEEGTHSKTTINLKRTVEGLVDGTADDLKNEMTPR